jgi:hypothetical protein
MQRSLCEENLVKIIVTIFIPRSTVGAAATKEDLHKHDVSREHIITFDVDNSVGDVKPTGMHC